MVFTCHLYTQDGCKRLFSFDAKPVCEVDYCDHCGDCLVCHIEDDCKWSSGRGHAWILYADKVEAFIVAHELDLTLVGRIRDAVEGEKDAEDQG